MTDGDLKLYECFISFIRSNKKIPGLRSPDDRLVDGVSTCTSLNESKIETIKVFSSRLIDSSLVYVVFKFVSNDDVSLMFKIIVK